MYSAYLIDYNGTPTNTTPTPVREELYVYDPITYDEGLVITEPILNLGSSRAGSFECSLPPTNYGYGRIIKGLTRLVVKKDEKVKFMGRITSEDRDLYLNQKVIAEGAVTYLNDSLTEKKTFTYKTLFELLTYIFTNHNNKFLSEPWKQFHLSQENCNADFVGYDDTDISSNKLSFYSVNYDASLEILNELVELAGGVYKVEYNSAYGYWDVYIYKKYDLPITSNQPIEFGLNLLDLVQSYDYNSICTAVAPFGGDLIQTSKEIGAEVAGEGINVSGTSYPGAYWYPDEIYVRGENDSNYSLVSVSGGPWANSGYWSFKLNISEYNAAHPNEKLKYLYISYRGYKYTYDDNGTNKVCDCAWRVYDSIDCNIGYKTYTTGVEGFDSDINEVIDLSLPQYKDAAYVMVTGWGNLIKPLIRRDAIVVEDNDRLNISGCDDYGPDEDGLQHTKGEVYLYSNNLKNLYGLIEKKIEYDIEDEIVPVANFTEPYDDILGKATKYLDSCLGYEIGQDDDRESNKGNYQILQNYFSPDSGYSCIQYELPNLGDPNRPRGIFIYSRMNSLGDVRYDNKDWVANGFFAVYDTSWQVLYYETSDSSDSVWKSVERYLLDLSDPKYYGAKYIRVSGFGGVIEVHAIPSDDNYSRNKLMEQAKLYLTDYQWEKVVIEATAVDLNVTDKQWDEFDICSSAPVISSMHGVSSTMPISELNLQLDSPENNSIKLGYNNEDYITSQLSENSRLVSKMKAIEERRNS